MAERTRRSFVREIAVTAMAMPLLRSGSSSARAAGQSVDMRTIEGTLKNIRGQVHNLVAKLQVSTTYPFAPGRSRPAAEKLSSLVMTESRYRMVHFSGDYALDEAGTASAFEQVLRHRSGSQRLLESGYPTAQQSPAWRFQFFVPVIPPGHESVETLGGRSATVHYPDGSITVDLLNGRPIGGEHLRANGDLQGVAFTSWSVDHPQVASESVHTYYVAGRPVAVKVITLLDLRINQNVPEAVFLVGGPDV